MRVSLFVKISTSINIMERQNSKQIVDDLQQYPTVTT